MRTAVRYTVRNMRLDDIPQVMEIERESFPTMWPPTAFKRELQQNRLAHYIVVAEQNPALVELEESHTGRVGRFLDEVRHILSGDNRLPPPEERPELVVGVIGLWMLPDEAHIVTIAVRDSRRREGIGELLLISALEHAQERVQPLVTLECRVSNEPALRLYDKYGFEQLGVRPRYYSDNHEDAYILTVRSVLSEKFRSLLRELKSQHRSRWGEFPVDR